MKAWVVLALLALLAASVDFVRRGLPAYEQALEARDALEQRSQALAALLASTPLVAHAELAARGDARQALAAQLDERLLRLLESPTGERAPELVDVLTSKGPDWLGLQTDLGRRLVELAAGRPPVDRALARATRSMAASRVFAVESITPLHGGAIRQVEGLEELSTFDCEFVLVAEADDVVQVLEDLSPEPGEPVLSVSAASLRRIEPGLWPGDPVGLRSPPVRLWVTVSALFRTPRHVRGR